MTAKRKTVYLLISIVGFFLLFATSMIFQVKTGFAILVHPILPKNQHNLQATYYDLRMVPEQEQELKLELTNPTVKEQKATLQLNDATTNETGEIDYSDRTKFVKRDASLKISLKDIATAPSQVVIPAQQTITVTIRLKLPKEAFNGMILGGIKVILSDADTKEPSNYIVAVKITETDIPLKANLKLVSVRASRKSGKNEVKIVVQNNQATTLEDIAYVIKITKKNSDKAIYQEKVTGYQMAPNSSFDILLDYKGELFQRGNDQIHLIAESKVTGQKWEWKKEINFSTIRTNKNNFIASLSQDTLLVYIVICTSTFVCLLVLLLILLIQRRRKEHLYKEELYHRKRKRKHQNKPTHLKRTIKDNIRKKRKR